MVATDNSITNPATKSVSQLKTVDDLIKKVTYLKELRQGQELTWRLNLAFYLGKQYAYRVPGTARITTLPTEDGEKPRHRVRLISNQIMPGAQSLLSKYIKTKPTFYASPGSGGDQDVKAAQLAEMLLENWWSDLQLLDKEEEALLWTIIAGQGFWKITWDPHAGKSMKFMVDPKGEPILDQGLKDLYMAELKKSNIDPRDFEKVIYMGDVRVEALGPDKVYLDPAAPVFEECKYAVCIHDLDPDEVWVRWKKRVTPGTGDAVPVSNDVSLPFRGSVGSREPSTKRVYIGYFIPQPALPEGRYVVWIDGSDKQILADEKWPFPTHELPLVKFPGIRVPGAIYDSSVVEHAIPLQKELNKTLSQIVQYKNLTIQPRVWAPVGSLRQRVTTEAGAVYEYQPVGGLKPEIEKLPSMPPYVFDHLADISRRLDDLFGKTQVTEGTVPPNVEAGVAIDLLQEMATDRLMPTILLIEQALARAGRQLLCLAQKYYSEPRLLKLRGSNGSVQVKRFTQADIAGDVTIHVEVGSGLPRTRAGREARVLNLVDRGMLPMDRAWKSLDLADLKTVGAQMQRDEDHALREHDKLIEGVPLNQVAMREAIEAIQAGMNPETGQPLTPQDDPRKLIENASLQPTIAENFQTHLYIHADFINSLEFESLPEDVQDRFIDHFTNTRTMFFSLPVRPEPQAVKTSLQLKGAVNAPEVVKILGRAGIAIEPDEAMAPPIDTWVTDSVDKPDADAAGPGQEGNNLAQAAQIMLATHAAHADAVQKLAQANELHQHTLRKTKAEADLATKKAQQSNFKPRAPAKGK